MSDYGVAFVRTATPVVVGWLTSTVLGPFLDPAVATEAVSAFIALSYYAVVRGFEALGVVRAGWFLGFPRQPFYSVDTALAAAVAEAEREDVDGSEGSYA